MPLCGNCIYHHAPYNRVCHYCSQMRLTTVSGEEYHDYYVDKRILELYSKPDNNTLKNSETKNNRFLVGNIASVLLSEVVKIKIEKFSSIKVVITVKLKDATFETISMYDNYDDAKKAYDKMMIKYSEG